MLKVGLVGWAAATGNGGMNFDIARLSPWIDKWLCPKHPHLDWHEPYIKPVSDKVICCDRENDLGVYNDFLDGLDAVLYVEHPYLDLTSFDLVDVCKRRGIFTVCIPMWEWWPERKHWSQRTDMVWCVTKYTRLYMESLAKYLDYRCDDCAWYHRIYGDRWGIDIEQFSFVERQQAERLIFINGNGGGKGRRKGSEVLAIAASYIPDVKILMLTQNDNYPKPMPENVIVDFTNYPSKTEIFQKGDVLIAPSHWEGLGHQLYEAQASGLPVITTDAPPMNECGTDWLVPVSERYPYLLSGKPIPKVIADPKKLSNLLRSIQGCDIIQESRDARCRMEAKYNLKEVLLELKNSIQNGMQVSILGKEGNLGFRSTVVYENYENLVKDAWYAYDNGNLSGMVMCLTQSLQCSPFLKIETVTDWVDTFMKLSVEAGKPLDTYSLTRLSEWRDTIRNQILKSNQY
ncbi:glycosyltransferase [Arthrospira platensis SPKY2]